MKSQTVAVEAVLFTLRHDSPVSLQKIADHLGITKRTLTMHLSRAMKISLTAFRRAYRMQLAAKIIQCSPQDTTIAEICKEINFQHTTTFSKYFKMEIGISPRAYQLKYGHTKKLPENGNISDDLIKQFCKKHIRR